MYKVVIIDDEKKIVRGLTQILDWSRLNCEISGTAYNGKEGYGLISSACPDIVITDIKMPYMDGLEMIKALKDQGCTSRFVILSGYAEFEYAKKGIEMGVSSYLLKPVDEVELETTVKELIAEIKKEKENNSRIGILERNTGKLLQFREYLLKDLVDGAVDDVGDIQDMLESLHISFNNSYFVCALIELENLMMDSSERQILDIRECITENYSGRALVFQYNPSQFAMIINEEEKVDMENILCSLNGLRNKIFEKYKYPVTIGVGKLFDSIGQIPVTFHQALYAVNFKAIKGKNTIISYHDISQYASGSFMAPEDLFQKLEDSIYDMDDHKAASLVNRFIHILVENRHLTPLNLQLQCMSLLMYLARKMNSMQLELSKFVGRDIMSIEEISRYKTVEEIRNWLSNTVRSLIEIRRNQSKNTGDIIENVKEYIAEHFAENITLNSLAEQFFINPYYLSQLFKKKTGQTYSRYLTEVRINRAKQLLLFTDYKIHEISEKVGYLDVKYFRKTFEKCVGCNPSKYKVVGNTQRKPG